jgi:hypothetical protein
VEDARKGVVLPALWGWWGYDAGLGARLALLLLSNGLLLLLLLRILLISLQTAQHEGQGICGDKKTDEEKVEVEVESVVGMSRDDWASANSV